MTNYRTNCVTSTELSMRNSARDQLLVEKHKTEITKTQTEACKPLLWVVAILGSGLTEALTNGEVFYPDTQEKMGL